MSRSTWIMESLEETRRREMFGIPSDSELDKVLQTPFANVFSFSADGMMYQTPAALLDTPIAKIAPDDAYWVKGWHDLEAYLANEAYHEQEKAKWEQTDRTNIPENAKKFKWHSDKVSHHRRIRIEFGADSHCHPNQLVAKRHLPDEGLCCDSIMYKVACKLNDLSVLKRRGELVMEPFDFLRWRLSLLIGQEVALPWQSAKEHVKRLISALCDTAQYGHKRHADPFMAKAILRSARYQEMHNKYAIANKNRAESTRGMSVNKHTARRREQEISDAFVGLFESPPPRPGENSPPPTDKKPFPVQKGAPRVHKRDAPRMSKARQPTKSGYEGTARPAHRTK